MSNPYPHQVTGAAFLKARKKACLFDDMGLGKTRTALMAAPPRGRLLVVCPAIAKSVWEQEVRLWRPDLTPSVRQGRGSFSWPEEGEAVVLNYDILPLHLIQEPPPDGVVLVADEAHYLKSWTSRRSKRFGHLSTWVLRRDGSVWLLTGTPLMNQPPDLWNVLQAGKLAMDVFGTWKGFQQAFGAYKDQMRLRNRVIEITKYGKAAPWVQDALSKVSLRRTKAEVLRFLPPKTHRTLEVEITPELRTACDQTAFRLAAGGDLDEAIRTKSNDEHLATLRRGLALQKAIAVTELLDLYRDSDQPLVVMSAHRGPVELLGSRPGWRTILGGTPVEERAATVRAFQAGRVRGIVATIGAAGTGVTLTRASDVLFIDLDWSPAANAQAEDRLHRIGQTRGVTVTVVQADHDLDRAIVRVLTRKAGIIASAGLA